MSFNIEIDSTLISLGAIWNLSGSAISGLGIPSDPEDLVRAEDAKTRLPIATPGFVSPFVKLSGSMMVGNIDGGNTNSITDLPVSTVNLAVSSVQATSSGFQKYFQTVQDITSYLANADIKMRRIADVLGLNPGTTCQLLPLRGGTMEGKIIMAPENLLIIQAAVDDRSPIMQSNLTGKALLAGTSLTGNLNMSGHNINNMKGVGDIASFADKKYCVTVQDVIDSLNDTRKNTTAPYIIYNPSPVTSSITSGSLYDWKMTGSASFTSSDASTYFSLDKSTMGGSFDRIRIYRTGIYMLTFFIEYVPATIVSNNRSLLNVHLEPDTITVGNFALNRGKAAYLSLIIPINENFVVAGPYLELILNNAGTVKQTGWQISRLAGDL